MNVTDWRFVPIPGIVDGAVNAKVPGTGAPAVFVAAPPVKVELARVWPWLMDEDVGRLEIMGVVGRLVATATLNSK